MKRLILAVIVLAISLAGRAQAQLGVYAGYSAAKLNTANTDWIYGPTFGAYFDHSFPVVEFGGDARVAVLNTNASTKVTQGLIGPRVALHLPVVPFRPYAEVLGGVAHVQVGQGSALSNGTSVAYGYAAGADVTVVPHLDWRVVEFSYTHLNSSSSSEKSLTTGLVVPDTVFVDKLIQSVVARMGHAGLSLRSG